MTKKSERTNKEMIIDWLADGCQNELKKQGFTMTGLKLKYSGLAWMIIVNVEHDDTAFVGFVAGGSIESAARKLRKKINDNNLKLKLDDWAD